MDRLSESPTFSPKDIIDTLKSIYPRIKDKEQVLDGAYMLAGEILGVSDDSINEFVTGVVEDGRWELCGDVNTAEYGGTLVRVDERGDLEYIRIAVSSDSGDKFLFHGTIVDPKDYFDEDSIRSDAMDSDCTPEEYLSKYPAAFADTLFSGYGCGIFEFSPSNINGQGCYSMRYEDFTVTDEDIVKFLKEMEVPCDTYLSVM